MAAARMMRLRRVSRNRRPAGAPTCRGHRRARTGHKTWSLPRFRGRVKFRPILGFGLHVPAVIEGGAAGAVRPPAAPNQYQDQDERPPASRRRRSASCPACIAAGRRAATPARTGSSLSPVVASTAASKSSPASSRRSSGRQRSGRVPTGQFGDRRGSQRVRGVRVRGRSAERAVQRRERRDGAAHDGRGSAPARRSAPIRPRPTRRSPRRTRAGTRTDTASWSARCASSCRRVRSRSPWSARSRMVRAPGSAMAAPQDGARPEVSESRMRPSGTTISRSAPGSRRPRPGQSAGRSAASASSRATACWAGQATAVTRPTWTAVGAALQQEGESYETRLRGTSPPAAATSSISLQRLAHGLNLLALCPSAQVCIASSR